MPSAYTFRTPRYEVQFTQTPYLQYALIFTRPIQLEDWPLAAAADVGLKKTRQRLIMGAIHRLRSQQLRKFFLDPAAELGI